MQVTATDQITFYCLPMVGIYPPGHILQGQKYTISRGLFHFQHSQPNTTTGWTADSVTFSRNITFNGQCGPITNPDKSDAWYKPLGLARPAIWQVTYNEHGIREFTCHANFRNFASSPIAVGMLNTSTIGGRMENINRPCIGAVYHPGATPYEINIEGLNAVNVSSAFDASRPPGANTMRQSRPQFNVRNSQFLNVWNRTKIHGDWDALIERCEFVLHPSNGYAAIDVPNETVGEVAIRDVSVRGAWSTGITWSFQQGCISIERLRTYDCRCPILRQGNIHPTVSGPNEYRNAVYIYYPAPGDITYTVDMPNWNQRAKDAVDWSYNNKVPPNFGWNYQISINGTMTQQQYAGTKGWPNNWPK